MFEKNNSIKEILNEAKDKLSKDRSLLSEKEEFNQRLSKALEGNVLILNKVYGTDSSENVDQRSKKITEIVEHQSALILEQEVNNPSSSILILNQEVKDTLVLKNEIDGQSLVLEDEYTGAGSETINQIKEDLNEIKDRSEQKDPFIERLEQLEEKQTTLFTKLDEVLSEIQSKDPTEDINLKFDILTNQIQNQIDERLEKIENDFNEKKDQIHQIEEKLVQIDSSFENLSNSIENLDFKIEEFVKNLNESLSQNIQEQTRKFEQNQLAQDEKINSKLIEYEKNIENRFGLLQEQIKSSIDQLHKYIEEEKLRKEEDKKNDPEYQSNLRLNNIYKILEMQISQSLVGNLTHNQLVSESDIKPSVQSKNPEIVSEVVKTDNKELVQKLDEIKNQLNQKVQIDDQGIKEIYDLTNSKIQNLEQIINQNQSSFQKQINDNNERLLNYFKSNELKPLNGLNFDLASLRQFDDVDQAKNFIQNLILKETQNWIKNNQKSIEDICKKIIYK